MGREPTALGPVAGSGCWDSWPSALCSSLGGPAQLHSVKHPLLSTPPARPLGAPVQPAGLRALRSTSSCSPCRRRTPHRRRPPSTRRPGAEPPSHVDTVSLRSIPPPDAVSATSTPPAAPCAQNCPAPAPFRSGPCRAWRSCPRGGGKPTFPRAPGPARPRPCLSRWHVLALPSPVLPSRVHAWHPGRSVNACRGGETEQPRCCGPAPAEPGALQDRVLETQRWGTQVKSRPSGSRGCVRRTLRPARPGPASRPGLQLRGRPLSLRTKSSPSRRHPISLGGNAAGSSCGAGAVAAGRGPRGPGVRWRLCAEWAPSPLVPLSPAVPPCSPATRPRPCGRKRVPGSEGTVCLGCGLCA